MVASDRQRHFLRARVFRFFPDAAAFARGGTQLRWVSLHGPNSISCGLLIFSSFFFFLSFPLLPLFLFLFLRFFLSVMELRESEKLREGKRRGKKVGRDGIFYGECVHGWRGESNRELHAATRMLVSRGIPLVHLRSFAKPILTRLRFDVHARA